MKGHRGHQYDSVCAIEPASFSLSAQVVPDPTAAAVLVQRAALDQHPEVLLERVAAGPGLLDLPHRWRPGARRGKPFPGCRGITLPNGEDGKAQLPRKPTAMQGAAKIVGVIVKLENSFSKSVPLCQDNACPEPNAC